jgi:PAS domain S-box-containing protein
MSQPAELAPLRPELDWEPGASDRLLRAVFDSALDAILIADDAGRYVAANPAACALLGLHEGELLGRSVSEFTAPEFDQAGAWSSFLDQGRQSGEIAIVRCDGSIRHVEYNAISNVLPGRHLSILRDVSERKRREQSEEELSDFFENATVGLHWVGPDGTILRANRAELELLGYSREEYVGRPIADFHADEEVIADILERLDCGQTLENYRARMRHKDGSIRYVLINSNVYRENGRFVHTRCFTRDITDWALAEERLRLLAQTGQLFSESLDLHETLDNVARLAVPVLADWCVLDVTSPDGTLERRTAVHADPVLQARVEALQHCPFDLGESSGSPSADPAGQSLLVPELTLERIAKLGGDEAYRQALRDLAPRSLLSVPLIARDRQLGTWSFARSQGAPPYDRGDLQLAETLARRAALAIDNARLYREAEAANRSKDRFLAALSHELRTPLTPVLALVSMLQGDPGLREDQRRYLTTIRRNVELEVRLIDDLLDLTRIARGRLELHSEVAEVHGLLEHALETCCTEAVGAGRLTVETDLAAPEARVWADGPRLIQVFCNLLSNAVKFTPEGGTVRVSTGIEEPGDGPGELVVEISDSGIGIEPEALPRIFDAFEQGELGNPRRLGGLGLGLAISKAVLELHGGSLTAASQGRGQGATFTARLPLYGGLDAGDPAEKDAVAPQAPPAHPGARPLRILLVEDHADTAGAMVEVLRSWGHSVVLADAVAAALHVLSPTEDATGSGEARPPDFDLVISDLGLPDGSGLDVMRQACRQGLPGIALSGYGTQEDVRQSREAGFRVHVTKPVSLEALKKAIRIATA